MTIPVERLRLTPKESIVLAGVAQGMRNKEIALHAGTTEQVVKNRLKQVFDKVGVNSRTELALYCERNRLLETIALPSVQATPFLSPSTPLHVQRPQEREDEIQGQSEPAPILANDTSAAEAIAEVPKLKSVPPATASTSVFPEVMTIQQAAQYLGVPPDTLYKYVGEWKIPSFKLGNQWRLKKSLLDQRMEAKSAPPGSARRRRVG